VTALVEDVVIVKTKALSRMTENHEAQLLSHLRLSRRTVGLLINFHVRHLRHGIKRMVNNYKSVRVGGHAMRSPFAFALPRRASALNMF
jgi:hypothetical protein